MNLIKIAPLENGAHANQNIPVNITVLEGWAVIPDGFNIPTSFPFVDIEVEKIDGVETVVKMTEREVPVFDNPEEPVSKTLQEQIDELVEKQAKLENALEDADALNVDQEYRLTLLELGIDVETLLN